MSRTRTKQQKAHAVELRNRKLHFSALEHSALNGHPKDSVTGSSVELIPRAFAHSQDNSKNTYQKLFGYDTTLIYQDLVRTLMVVTAIFAILGGIYWKFHSFFV